MKTDTPETDDQEDYGLNREWADFARRLERQRNQAIAERDQFKLMVSIFEKEEQI